MTNRIKVVPGEGRSVPDPLAGDLLPAEGREVDDSIWWRRRKDDNDVTIQDVAVEAVKSTKSSKTEVAE